MGINISFFFSFLHCLEKGGKLSTYKQDLTKHLGYFRAHWWRDDIVGRVERRVKKNENKIKEGERIKKENLLTLIQRLVECKIFHNLS